jgi:hypothetical protein
MTSRLDLSKRYYCIEHSWLPRSSRTVDHVNVPIRRNSIYCVILPEQPGLRLIYAIAVLVARLMPQRLLRLGTAGPPVLTYRVYGSTDPAYATSLGVRPLVLIRLVYVTTWPVQRSEREYSNGGPAGADSTRASWHTHVSKQEGAECLPR